MASVIRPHAEYSSEQLNILALMFTAVKMLFVCGVLQPLPAIVALLEPLRDNKSLHLTIIRNEHAYYSTIAQILRRLAYPLPSIPCCPSHPRLRRLALPVVRLVYRQPAASLLLLLRCAVCCGACALPAAACAGDGH